MSDYIERIPSYTLTALELYRDERVMPGGFLRCVLRNELREALGRADSANREHIQEIVWWVYNEMPAVAHGSQAAIDAWVAREDEEDGV